MRYEKGHKPANGFKKGNNANPGGRPKALQEVLAVGRANSVAIMQRLVDLALNHPDPSVQIAAGREVLNRTFGKPAQQIEVVGGLEHRHFVVRAPAVLESAEAWEAQFGAPALPSPEGLTSELGRASGGMTEAHDVIDVEPDEP